MRLPHAVKRRYILLWLALVLIFTGVIFYTLPPLFQSGYQSAAPTESFWNAPADTVDLNTAGAAELQTLDGIGETLAVRIVLYREEHGAFQTVEQLAEVKGISEKMVNKLRGELFVRPGGPQR